MIKQPQLFYFETGKVKPTAADGDKVGEVLAFAPAVNRWVSCGHHQVSAWPEQFTHWMQMPKAPSDQHEHAFLE